MTPLSPQYAAELARCYVDLAGRVFAYAHVKLGVDVAQAEDLVQRAFEKAAERWAELREPSADRLKFLCAVVWCDVADAFRRDSVVRAKQAEVWRTTLRPYCDPFEVVQLQLLVEQLNKEITNMPPRRRTVAEFKWGWNLSNQEIAVVVGITDKAVSSHVSAARAALRKVREELEGIDVGVPEGGSDR